MRKVKSEKFNNYLISKAGIVVAVVLNVLAIAGVTLGAIFKIIPLIILGVILQIITILAMIYYNSDVNTYVD